MINYTLNSTILLLDKVDIGYGDTTVLKNISLIEKDVIIPGKKTGQVIAFISRSGRGKSTLFKALTGIIKPLNGKMYITDFDDTTDSAKEIEQGDIGLVSQKYTLFRHKTVYNSLMYSLRNQPLSKQQKEDKIKETLNIWELTAHKDKYPNELSGGQRQRVAIAEQLLRNRHILILDEPISGLDVVAIDNVKEAFSKIQNEHELNTIIFSTHDLNFAVETADSIYVLGKQTPTDSFSTIIHHYDLKAMNLAWKELSEHEKSSLITDIKTKLKNS